MNMEAGSKEEVVCVFLGMDVSKDTFDLALVSERDAGCGRRPAELPAEQFPRTQEGSQEMLRWARSHCAEAGAVRFMAVMEATGSFSVELAAWLVAADPAVTVAIVNPHDAAHHRKSLGMRNNTDKISARALALFGLERRPRSYEPLPAQRAELRALNRYRDQLVQQRTALKNRMQDAAVSKWVRKQEQARLKRLEKDIDRVEKQLQNHVKLHADLQHDVELLRSIPGVGFLTAVVILAEVGDLRSFGQARPLGAFVGLSPEHNESGTSVRGHVRMSKKGNSRARQALYIAAMTTIRYPSVLTSMYERLIAKGKRPISALGAVMHKMLIIMRAMCISDTPFNREGKSGGKTCGKVVESPASAT
jgi:transposase